MISIITLLIVFVLIAVRQVGNIRLRIWQIMLAGALVVLVTGQISPADALAAISADVMLFLFGVFIIGQALEDSGYLGHLAYRLFSRARSLNGLVLFILFGMGILSALLLLAGRFQLYMVLISFALNMLITWVIFLLSQKIAGFMGQGGMTAISRVFSLLLAAIAVSMVIGGLQTLGILYISI